MREVDKAASWPKIQEINNEASSVNCGWLSLLVDPSTSNGEAAGVFEHLISSEVKPDALLLMLFSSTEIPKLLSCCFRRLYFYCTSLTTNEVSPIDSLGLVTTIALPIHDGGALVLPGANGFGKSTFLPMLASFSQSSASGILLDGPDITQSGTFHQYKLQLDWVSLKDTIEDEFTVMENVQWFEVLECKPRRSLPALGLMGLTRLAKEKARKLSMGL
ncbi:hypothetical protein Nepgr_006289 [Nepenthes gracilis]|uniref:ABC transporter domain-containing protein n=1 Tax=Nepenthes gracilis TaxID=150966 RepID=A0AAD3S4V6_NEPGR|nr:hypothetical protein Nepgr_006289 [Nepenthes gracilis]